MIYNLCKYCNIPLNSYTRWDDMTKTNYAILFCDNKDCSKDYTINFESLNKNTSNYKIDYEFIYFATEHKRYFCWNVEPNICRIGMKDKNNQDSSANFNNIYIDNIDKLLTYLMLT